MTIESDKLKDLLGEFDDKLSTYNSDLVALNEVRKRMDCFGNLLPKHLIEIAEEISGIKWRFISRTRELKASAHYDEYYIRTEEVNKSDQCLVVSYMLLPAGYYYNTFYLSSDRAVVKKTNEKLCETFEIAVSEGLKLFGQTK